MKKAILLAVVLHLGAVPIRMVEGQVPVDRPRPVETDSVLQSRDSAESRFLGARLTLPFADIDARSGIIGIPSMGQSLALTNGFYQIVPVVAARAWAPESRAYRRFMASFGLVAFFLPLGEGWLHEEWHRSVLRHRRIESFNDIYRFRPFEGVVRVSQVADSSLVRLKQDHPVDHVRLTAAGIEGQYSHLTEMEKHAFFSGSGADVRSLILLSTVNSVSYLLLSGTRYADRLTDRLIEEEGSDMAARDFAGVDFTAWVYDLFRPDEPYASRGMHPSGFGIDRYVKTSDLSRQELGYLRRQGLLSLLNFARPNLLLPGRMEVGAFQTAAGLRHLLTPFGSSVELELFLASEFADFFIVARRYENGERAFPGVEAELHRFPVVTRHAAFLVTPRFAVWLQPTNLRFRDDTARGGAFAEIQIDYSSGRGVDPFARIRTKSAGWLAGEVRLDAGSSAEVGLRLHVR